MKITSYILFAIIAVALWSCENGDAEGVSDTGLDTAQDSGSDISRDTSTGSSGNVTTDSESTAADTTGCSKALLSQTLTQQLDAVTSEVDFAFQLEDETGSVFNYARGEATMNTPYESASTSKWVTAAIILKMVDDGILCLDDSPQDYLSSTEWPVEASHSLSGVTLRHLLNFTSGLANDSACPNLPNRDYFECVASIAEDNLATGVNPGAEFYYSSNHMQVAGAMAIRAGGYTDWASLFAAFKAETGLFQNSDYNKPSTTNPRLAGGMTWTGADYMDFIRAFKNSSFYAGSDIVVTASNDRLGSASITYSPAMARTGEDWHYGLGMWIECHSATYNCAEVAQVSSAGAFGAYPFWNKKT